MMKKKINMDDDQPRASINDYGNQRFTKVPPAHYTVRMESFSLLSYDDFGKYETRYFEVDGYSWRLVFYPNGYEKKDGNRQTYTSIFLEMAKPDDISLGWEVNVNVSFFVLDQIRDRFLIIQDVNRKEWRFHAMKTKWGFSEFLSRDVLDDHYNGYVVDDCCTIGVEVCVIKPSLQGERLSFIRKPQNGQFSWAIDDYSDIDGESYMSDVFTIEGRIWFLEFYPKGDSSVAGPARSYISLFLWLDDAETPEIGDKVFVECVMRVRDQLSGNHHEVTIQNWYDAGSDIGYGIDDFMLRSTLENPSMGYLVNDGLIVEAEFKKVSVVNDFSYCYSVNQCNHSHVVGGATPNHKTWTTSGNRCLLK